MAKTAAVIDVEDDAETPVAEVATPTTMTIAVDNLFEISEAAAKVAGYYAGTTYESDREDGEATLSKYGIAVG